MANDLLAAAALLWCLGGLLALGGQRLGGRSLPAARGAIALGGIAGIAGALVALPHGAGIVSLPFLRIADTEATFSIASSALWLMGFGLAPAVLAALLASPVQQGEGFWLFGLAVSLLGALGVFGMRDGAFFLIAWELMSLGGAAMILAERLNAQSGQQVLFMLGLLEVGAIALLVAILILGTASGTLDFAGFAKAGAALPGVVKAIIGLLLLIGFGAKLGLLPFYEWFPGAYGAASGATGAILSGVILNAAFYGLARGLLEWLPPAPSGADQGFGILLCVVGVLSAILAALYAFQQEDWRDLLAFSSAENAGIAVIALGAALLFRAGHLPLLAGLAFTVALLHLAGHALAKGCLFLAADGVFAATGSYAIVQSGLLRGNRTLFGIGALFAAMSLAAMPPQSGFVSEWFMFQTVFQDFHLPDLGGRLTLALTGAGLALIAAIAFATFVKVFGIGLMGAGSQRNSQVPAAHTAAVGVLGFGVLALAVGMPIWLGALEQADIGLFGADAAAKMTAGWILVPLTDTFAFISPSKLIIVMPLLALVPIGLVLLSRRFPVRHAPIWYGGSAQDSVRAATTALTFSNSLRTFYSFVYHPRAETQREIRGQPYFVSGIKFNQTVAPFFGPYVFTPMIRLVWATARWLRVLQSGYLNIYLAILGVLLVIIFAISLV